MAFPVEHFLLTLHWRPALYPDETGQIGLRFHVPGVAAAQSIVNAVQAPAEALWKNAAAKIPGDFQLTFARLARISTNGRYKTGTNSFDFVWPTPLSGVGGSLNPIQTACATTLLTSVTHGQASKGRIFLPPISTSGNASGDFLWSVADCDARSTAVATFLSALNVIMGGPAVVMSSGTQRSVAGLGRAVTSVATGRRPDVQRRRGKGVPDVRSATKTVTIPAPGDPGEVLANP